MRKKLGIALLALSSIAQGNTNIAPTITDDRCGLKIDKQGYQTCKIYFSNGRSDRYWKKSGKTYWAYPANKR